VDNPIASHVSWTRLPGQTCKVTYTDKKENQIFLIYKEIQNGVVAKSYMAYGLLIYG
jgi:hypothetical protein